MRLNVGSHQALPGWVNIDRYHGCDIRADARALPFRDQSFDRVLASHVLEHVTRGDADLAAHECGRVLKARGELVVRGPDCPSGGPIQMQRGNPDSPGMAHRWECDASELESLVQTAGLQPMPVAGEWPQSEWPLPEVELMGVK